MDAQSALSYSSELPGPIVDDQSAIRLLTVLSQLDLFELRLELDVDLAAIWCFQQHKAGANFAPRLLKDIRKVQRAIQDFHRDEPSDAAKIAKFLIWASDIEGLFNLGGDLAYFETLVRSRNYDQLRAYALSCIDVCFANYSSLDAPIIVGALVAGDALGGGMESALSCDFIVAEEQAKFGLPEMVYGLFPGMGAYSFLARRLGQSKAESIISNGRLYSASDMHDMALVERVVTPGTGRKEMNRFLTKTLRRYHASLAIYNARRRIIPITFQEMADIVEDWVSVAMGLTDQDLRKMTRLAAAQSRLHRPQPPLRKAGLG
jgi:DSF synthase